MNAASAMTDTHTAWPLPLAGGLRLNVHQNLESVEARWRHLETQGIATVYQTFDWCRVWLQEVAANRGITPCIVTAEDVFGETKFILPLQLRRKYGLTIAEMLTAPQGAYAFGLFNTAFLAHNAIAWFRRHLPDIVAALPRHDIFRLADAPETVNGFLNPLCVQGSFLAANLSHIMMLQPDYQALLEAKRTSETRRSLRKRDNKLESAGVLEFGLPASSEDSKKVLSVMFSDQEKRLAEAGVHNLFAPEERRFILKLAEVQTASGSLLRPYTLRINGEVQAVLLGAAYANRYWALISSMADSSFRKLSPGDYALRAMFKALCEDGTEGIDFAAGDSAYKQPWSDRAVALRFVLRTSSLKGLLPASVMLLREKIKRLVKQTDLLRNAAFAVRKTLAGRKPQVG